MSLSGLAYNRSEFPASRGYNPIPPCVKDAFGVRELTEKTCTYVEVGTKETTHELLLDFVPRHSKQIYSFQFAQKPKQSAYKLLLSKLRHDQQENEDVPNFTPKLGLGLHEMTWEGEDMFVLYQEIGEPVFTNCGPQVKRSLVVIMLQPGKMEFLMTLFDHIFQKAKPVPSPKYLSVYKYAIASGYWKKSIMKMSRSLESVILPEKDKNIVLDDMKSFFSDDAITWYFDHGIPYKRGYLFSGPPGCGKTSFLQALASEFGRILCFMQPTHPDFTDDAFETALASLPNNSMVVLEDIDALFTKERKHKSESKLTFSGLLNGLDGIGNPDGQIFILTTNYADRLDPALIRAGRVDLHVEFSYATSEQLTRMFLLFYTEDEWTPQGFDIKTLSEEFADKWLRGFPDGVTMAAVQQHMIVNRTSTPQEVVDAIGSQQTDEQDCEEEQEKITEEQEKDSQDKVEEQEKVELQTETETLPDSSRPGCIVC